MQLRKYQREALDCCFRIWREKQSAMVVIPTGGGKTCVFSSIAKRFLDEIPDKNIMVFAHREELIYQAKKKLEAITGRDVGIEMGQERVGPEAWKIPKIVVSTVQTLSSKSRLAKFDPSKYSLLVMDELHHGLSLTNRKVIEHFKQNPNLKFLGVTATPERSDNLALGAIIEEVAINYGVHDAVNDGWLVRPKQLYVNISGIDLRRVRTTAGDLNQGDLSHIMEEDRNARAVVDAINSASGDKQTLVFAASVIQADKMCVLSNMFKPGSSRFICGETPKEERHEIHRLFVEKKITRLFNCGVLTEGYDNADVEIIAVARPTKSRALYQQIVGRGLRPIDSISGMLGSLPRDGRLSLIASSVKPFCTILDFVGNSGRHKLVSLVDVLGGRYPESLREAVARKAKREGRVIDVEVELDRMEKTQAAAVEKLRVKERERHEKLVSQTKYTLTEIDPFDVLGIYRMQNTIEQVGITENQKIFLEKQGVSCDKLTKKEASRLIVEILTRRKLGKPSFKQQAWLTRFGYPIPPQDWKKILDERLGNRRGGRA